MLADPCADRADAFRAALCGEMSSAALCGETRSALCPERSAGSTRQWPPQLLIVGANSLDEDEEEERLLGVPKAREDLSSPG